jgi:putative protease
MDEIPVGTVTHYFPQIGVAAVEVTGDGLRIGDTIRLLGATSNFTQQVQSMEMDHSAVAAAEAGQLVAIQLVERARVRDVVFRIRPHGHPE